jgi:hypothetical protein
VEQHRDLINRRLGHMREERSPYDSDYRSLSDAFLPNRWREEATRNTRNRRHKNINTTALFASKTLASGLHSGLTSPARPWFRTTLQDKDLADWGPVRQWMDIAETRVRQAFSASNLYEVLPFMYGEFGTYGNMAGMCFEDDRNPAVPFRFEAYTAGQYFLATNYAGDYDTMYRPINFTVRQLVDRFGLENCSVQVQIDFKGNFKEKDVKVLHTVEPSPKGGGWDSCYWELNCDKGHKKPLAHRNIRENPILAAAWERVLGDSYATTCPGFEVLGLSKAIQIEEINKARSIELHHKPPLQIPSSMKSSGVSILPGAENYVNMDGANQRISSMYDFKPDVNGLMDNIRKFEGGIKELWFTDLFLMLTLDERAQRATAEEIRARYDEKVLSLGPTLERANKMLRMLFDRAFGIMYRRSLPIWEGKLQGEPLFPPPPEELLGKEIKVEFISTLQQAMRAVNAQQIERVVQFAGAIAQVTGEPPVKLDGDQAIDEFADSIGLRGKVVRDDDTVQSMREAAQQQQQMAQMAQMAPAIKDGAAAMKMASEAQSSPDGLMAQLAGAMGQ